MVEDGAIPADPSPGVLASLVGQPLTFASRRPRVGSADNVGISKSPMQTHSPKQSASCLKTGPPRVLVATTAMLAFISFWRAAAVVLNDMGSSAFYAGAIAEHFVGKTAPWFVLAIMLLSYAVRSVYIESSSMFVRGGVYRVVKEAMGRTLAKLSL